MHRFKDFEQKKKDFYRFGWGVKVYLLNLFLLDITTAFLASCLFAEWLSCNLLEGKRVLYGRIAVIVVFEGVHLWFVPAVVTSRHGRDEKLPQLWRILSTAVAR